jgi:hypothetical protein
MLNPEPPPAGTTKPFASIFTSSQCSRRSSQLSDQDITPDAG